MATLRLFASVREAAGVARWEADAPTVAALLDRAVAHFGPDFAAALAICQVWRNGDPVAPDERDTTELRSGDEVALLPPVSGGAVAIPDERRPGVLLRLAMTGFFAAAVVFVLVTGQLLLLAILALVAGAVLVWDYSVAFAERDAELEWQPLCVATALAAYSAYNTKENDSIVLFSYVAAIGLVLLWSLVTSRGRGLEELGLNSLVAVLVVAMVTYSVYLYKLRENGDTEELWMLVLMVGAFSAGTTTIRVLAKEGPLASPQRRGYTQVAGVMLATAIGAGLHFLLDACYSLGAGFLIGALTSGAIVLGRALGALLRHGDLIPESITPGVAQALDMFLIAPAVFFLAARVLLTSATC